MQIFIRALAAGLALLFAGLQGATAASLPPLEAFGKRPMISDVKMSPGGTHFAALQWIDSQAVLVVYNPFSKDPKEKVRMLALDASKKVEEKVETFSWLNDDTIGLVFEFEGLRARYQGERGGIPTQETRLVAVSSDLKKIRQIPKLIEENMGRGQFQHRILDYLDHDPEHVLMVLDQQGFGRELNVYRITLRNGNFATLMKGGPDVAWYLSDQQSEVRLRGSYTKTRSLIHSREPGSYNWTLIDESVRPSGRKWWPLEFSADTNVLLVGKTGADGFDKVHSYDLTTKSVGETVFSHAQSDVLGLRTDRYTRQIIGYTYAVDSSKIHYTDPELKSIQAGIDQALPGKVNALTSWDRKRSMFVVLSSGPKDPGTYYMFVRNRGQLAKILDRNAIRVDPAALGTMQRISYKARDGREIPAYLTTPPGNKGAAPLIVMPHGGPTARDYLEYDYWVQFLASRGYAVLQPQFRGSSGFGVAFQTAGYKQWGMLMQDDVTDGAKAMVERGIADPNRMCIVGGSYGGYAALMGAVLTPDLYQCAVSMAGVTDIVRMLREKMHYKFATDNPPNVGSRMDDKDQLRDTSPINNIDAIEIPILLVHGDKDLAVDVSHSTRMAKALKKARKPHKLVILKDGNHYLQIERHRIRFLKELEAFLDKHIGD